MEKKEIEYLFFNTEISGKTSIAILQEFQEIVEDNKEPRLVLSSYGGEPSSSIFIHDQIKLHWPDMIIIGSGTMQSAALDIFFAAKPENRYVTEHCSMFLHEMYCKKKGKKITFSKGFNQLGKNIKKEFVIERDFGHDIFMKGTGLSKKQIKKLEEKETWLRSDEIVKYGFASRIITSLDGIV